jgi:hypothetical protein
MDIPLFFIFFYLLPLVWKKQGQPDSFIKPFLNYLHSGNSFGSSIVFFSLASL